MEELQDAIEDAQYVNAMHDDTPKPTKEWKFPSTDEMNAFVTRLTFSQPKLLELDTICEDSLGFFLVLFYLFYQFILSIYFINLFYQFI